MRTALGRARRLAAFLLLALTAGWVLRRRSGGPSVAGGAARADAGRDVPETDAVLAGEPPVGAGAPAAGTGEAGSGPAAGAGRDARRELPAADAGMGAEPAPRAVPVEDRPAAAGQVPGGAAERAPAEDRAGAPGEVPGEVLATDAGLTPEPPPGLAGPDAMAVLSQVEASEAPTAEIPAVDDLRALRGIGPSMERLLHGLGITTYRQLAMLEGEELERVRAALPDFRSRIEREDWVGQARELHRRKYGEAP